MLKENYERPEKFYDRLSQAFTPFDLLLWSADIQVCPTLENSVTSHIDWFLAASEEARDLEDRLGMTVGYHLLDVGATDAYLALASAQEDFPDIDLIPTVSEGFADATRTTEEL